MFDSNEQQFCEVCGRSFQDELESVCADPVCQETRWRNIFRALAVNEAERVLDDAWWGEMGL